jgi:cytochrome c oxidase subunit 1
MFGNLLYAVFRGKRAPVNPWGALTLEWTVPSPPPTHQFEGPVEITHGPYDFPTTEDKDE